MTSACKARHWHRPPALRQRVIAASVVACFALYVSSALANPTGHSVVSGSASFASAGSTLTVTNSANAIIHWQGFSIGVNEITRFLQSSAGSAVLNRVVGSGGVIPRSVIDGMLQSNGRVFLLNPMGVAIGAGARIDVAGLVASSLNLSNEDFLAGRMRFTEVPGAGMVVNHGVIDTIAGGRVYLVAPGVENSGIIRAPQGEIVLAAGKSAELVSEASPYVTVRISADSEQALNVGSLLAEAGRVGMYGALVRNAGVAEASGAVVGPGGQVRLVATKDLTLDAGSRVGASGATGGQVLIQAQGGTALISGSVEAIGSAGRGGEIHALGSRLGIVGGAVIDASGQTGGGSVLVGGDYQGSNPAVQNAERTYVGGSSVVRADAGTDGDGGRIIVWADGDTRFYGSLTAQGGTRSGNGGFAEVSGRQHLDYRGLARLTAPAGATGTLLLDPQNIHVISGTDGGPGGTIDIGETAGPPFTFASIGESSETFLTDGTINAQLAGANVLVTTGGVSPSVGTISFLGGVSLASGGTNLTFDATRAIVFKSGMTGVALNGGQLTLRAQNGSIISEYASDGLALSNTPLLLIAGDRIGSAADRLQTTGLTKLAATSVFGTRLRNRESGDIEITSLGSADLSGGDSTSALGVTSSSGVITLRNAAGSITLNGAVSAGKSIELIADTDLVLNADLTSHGASTATRDFIYLTAGGQIASGAGAGNITTDGGEVRLNAPSGISVGSIVTRSTVHGRSGGSVYVYTDTGRILVDGNIDSHGAAAQYSCFDGCDGTAGGSIELARTSGETISGDAIKVTGSINTMGGTGFTSTDWYRGTGGGAGGSITVHDGYGNPVAGNAVLAGAIDTRGGNGGHGADGGEGGGAGGYGGSLTLLATHLGTGPIDTSGGIGGNGYGYSAWGAAGGDAGDVQTEGYGPYSILMGAITARGGRGGSSVNVEGGSGGGGGYVNLVSAGAVSAGPIDASGGSAGSSGSGYSYYYSTPYAGSGGSIVAKGTAVAIAGAIVTQGGAGTSATGTLAGGDGGNGGEVLLEASAGSITAASIDTSGGAAGTGGAAMSEAGAYAGAGGAGGGGGGVSISAPSGSIAVNGAIIARGSAGGAGGASDGFYPGASGGAGGSGGTVSLSALDQVLVGPPAEYNVTRTVIDTSGAAGGSAGADIGVGTGSGGAGGSAGDVMIDPLGITLTGVITATGGAGGAGGGTGGDGGNLSLTGDTITFINGGWDLSGGAGSPAGSSGVVSANGTLIFAFILPPPVVPPEPLVEPPLAPILEQAEAPTLESALAQPAVAQAIGTAIKEALLAANTEESGTDSEEEKSKKKGAGSCKP